MKLLQQICEMYACVNGIGTMEQVTIHEDKIVKADFIQVIDWLLEHGAKWVDDQESYKRMGYKNTYHLWLELPAVKLYCGFNYGNEGLQDVEIPMDEKLVYAIEKRQQYKNAK